LYSEESRGKSGVQFYFSQDKNIIFKELRIHEFRMLMHMLDKYIAHIHKSPSTFLCRFLGCYSTYDMSTGSLNYYICLKALFDVETVSQVFDLKGSTHKRTAGTKKIQKHVVLKDLDAMEKKLKIRLGRQLKTALLLQLQADVAFLREFTIIDYSFLVGVLDLHFRKGSRKKLAEEHRLKKVIYVGAKHRRPGESAKDQEQKVRMLLKEIHESIGRKSTTRAPTPKNKFHSIWTAEEMGGIRSRTIAGTLLPEAQIYFFGIIDFLQPYNAFKKMETGMKGLVHDVNTISCVNPQFYADRFLRFISSFLE